MFKMRILIVLCMALLGICTYTDIRKREIPGSLLLVFALLSLICRGAYGIWWLGITELLLRFLPGAVLLCIHAMKKSWLGTGDGLLVLLCGYLLGAEMIIQTVFAAFLFSGTTGLILLLAGRRKGKDTLPFAPFLLTGFAAVLILQNVAGGS